MQHELHSNDANPISIL